MDELTRRRLAHNEELFRAVNEEIDEHRSGGGKRAYVCECVDRGCQETMALSADEYEAVRAGERRFVVAPGHVVSGLEHVVEREETYDVVEKDDV